jgi:hypothetical protein
LLIDPPFPLHRYAQLLQSHVQLADRALMLEEVVDLVRVHKAVASGDDEGDPPPTGADDGGQLVLQATELECIIPLRGAGMVRLGGDQVAAGDQFVTLDGGVVVDGPPILVEGLGVVLDTNS